MFASTNNQNKHVYRFTKYLLCLPAALDDEDIGVDVLHTHPVGERQRGIGPNPVHHRPQLH